MCCRRHAYQLRSRRAGLRTRRRRRATHAPCGHRRGRLRQVRVRRDQPRARQGDSGPRQADSQASRRGRHHHPRPPPRPRRGDPRPRSHHQPAGARAASRLQAREPARRQRHLTSDEQVHHPAARGPRHLQRPKGRNPRSSLRATARTAPSASSSSLASSTPASTHVRRSCTRPERSQGWRVNASRRRPGGSHHCCPTPPGRASSLAQHPM